MLHVLLAACAVYSASCLVLLLVNVLALPRLSRERPLEGAVPFLSIVVPARNEERAVGEGVASLLAQDYPSFEVIVVDDRSTDRTREILDAVPAKDRLRVVTGAEPPAGWLGKPHALWQGARAARGELFLFVDADVRYHPRAVSQAVAFLSRRNADFVCLFPRLETVTFWESVLMPNLDCAVFLGPAFLANRDRPRWLAAGGGAGNLVRRAAYEAIGGHEPLRTSVIDDVRLALAIRAAGFRTRVVLAKDRVAVRMYHGFREVWNGFTKNVAYALGGWTGAVFFAIAAAWTAVSILPPAVLVLAAAAPSVLGAPPRDLLLAAAAFSGLVLARAILAALSGDRIRFAVTQPLMAAVWAALLVRSVWQRAVRRQLVWRGRAFDARKAGF
ncbi:MAG: glycosyltransferase [Acidobacteriota bacterium]